LSKTNLILDELKDRFNKNEQDLAEEVAKLFSDVKQQHRQQAY
jgi:hypothetical protein